MMYRMKLGKYYMYHLFLGNGVVHGISNFKIPNLNKYIFYEN